MFNHFNKINKKYLNNIGDKKIIYNEIASKINPFIRDKIILDIGSGGNIFYNYKLAKKLIALDPSEKSLKNLCDENIIKIVQDARDLSNLKKNSIDVILIVFALHHINGINYDKSINSIKKIIQESYKVLSKNGEIIILELTLNNFLYQLQFSLSRSAGLSL